MINFCHSFPNLTGHQNVRGYVLVVKTERLCFLLLLLFFSGNKLFKTIVTQQISSVWSKPHVRMRTANSHRMAAPWLGRLHNSDQ